MLVVEVDFQYAFLADTHFDVAGIDVFDDTATASIGLDAYHTLQFGRVHHVVLGIDVAASARYFRTDNHTTVTVFHLTVADDNVLTGAIPKASVTVAPTLNGNTVVASIEITVFYQHAIARLRVTSIAVRTVVDNLHTTYGDVFRQQGMNHPEWRTQQGEVFQEDVLTLVEVDKLWAQTVILGENALVHINTVFCLLQQSGTGATALVGQFVGCTSEVGYARPLPPCFFRAATIDSTFTSHSNVLLLVGIDAWTDVVAIETFPTCRHHGVEVWFKHKLQLGVFLHYEIDV